MKFAIGGRGSGKSVYALRWLAQDPLNRLVLTQSPEHLISTARAMYPHLSVDWTRRILPFGRVFNGSLRGRNDVEVYIDELEAFLQGIVQLPVVGATLTGLDVFDLGQRPA